MSDVEITTEEIQVKDDVKVFKLPQNFITIGNIEREDLQIYINQVTYKKIKKLSNSNVKSELGSFLIGNNFVQGDKKYLIITDFIEAKYTDATASSLTFTHETWDYVHNEQKKNYADTKIVGWHHTHPGYGIFLSNYDIFIQENFFNLDWQTALVVDPLADTMGFFQWLKEKVVKVGGFYIFDEVGKKIIVETKAAGIAKLTPKIPSKFNVTLIILLIATTLASFTFGINNMSMSNKEAFLKNDIAQLKVENENLVKENISLKESGKQDNTEIVMYQKYLVQKGDSLTTICSLKNINYNVKQIEILRVNDIDNPDQIYQGQTILLPL